MVITVRKADAYKRHELRQKRGGGKIVSESDLRAVGVDEEEGFDVLISRSPTPAFAVEVAEEFRRLLERLGDDELQQIALLKMEGCTVDEIADRRGLARRAVERRLQQIRQTWGMFTFRAGTERARNVNQYHLTILPFACCHTSVWARYRKAEGETSEPLFPADSSLGQHPGFPHHAKGSPLMYTSQRQHARDGRSRGRILIPLWLRSMLLLFMLLLVCPAGVRADEAPQIRATQKVVIDAVGDAHFTVDVKMPVALYTLLKDRTRNTALLLRQIGLSHEESYEVQEGKGEFDDGSSTVHFSWTTRGLVRPVHDDIWEAPVDETSGLELLYLHENIALFSTAAGSPFGVVPLVVHAEVAPGSSELRLLHSPSRLAYCAPVASLSRSGRASFDFEFQAKPQVMTCLAKSYGNPKFTHMWMARTVLKNTGDQAVTDYRVRFRFRDYAPSWSAWQHCARRYPAKPSSMRTSRSSIWKKSAG